MIEQWQELKETITEMRDNDGTGTQQEVCEFLANLMDVLEKQMQEPGDAISRKSIKQKLQEHHDFFVNAYGGFGNLPQNDKSRVDEITNCIAMVVNEPPVNPQEPKTGHWITVTNGRGGHECSLCHEYAPSYQNGDEWLTKYCPGCGCRMVEPQESEDNEDIPIEYFESGGC